jgi:lipoprotein-anchoring transpeptidase ErfK/SrfK
LPGYPASHGCIRMPEPKAKRFYDAAKLGTPVTVKR